MKHWAENKLTVRAYKVPSRFFNILLSVEDLQGDGFVRLTFILFYRALQVYVPFSNKRGWTLRWYIFEPR
jgi:hypothetical protein